MMPALTEQAVLWYPMTEKGRICIQFVSRDPQVAPELRLSIDAVACSIISLLWGETPAVSQDRFGKS